jgi:hypothetical protein
MLDQPMASRHHVGRLLTPERVVEHEHNLMQDLLVAGAPISQTDMSGWSDRCAASIACTRKALPERDPIREGVSWVDLASAGQLDPPLNAAGMRENKKLVFGREN